MNIKKLKKYVPEILTGVAIGSHITSNILFVRAAKKEEKDGLKRHYILPSILSGVSISSVIFADRYNAKEKGIILGAMAASTIANGKFIEKTRDANGDEETVKMKMESDNITEEDLKKITEELDKMDLKDLSKIPEGYEVYVFPQILGNNTPVVTTPDTMDFAYGHINEMFQNDMWVSVYEFLYAIDETGSLISSEDELFGWKMSEDDPYEGIMYIQHYQRTFTTESGKKVTVVYFVYPPLMEDEWDAYYDNMLEFD